MCTPIQPYVKYSLSKLRNKYFSLLFLITKYVISLTFWRATQTKLVTVTRMEIAFLKFLVSDNVFFCVFFCVFFLAT